MFHRSLVRVQAGRRKPSGRPVTTEAELVNILRVFNCPAVAGAAAAQVTSGRRNVATTSSSKVHQLATNQQNKQQQQQQQQQRHDNESVSSAVSSTATTRDKYQARLDHLSLWQSIETIKRFGYRLAQVDPLKMKQPEQLNQLAWSGRLVDELKSSTNIVPTSAFLDTKQPLMAINELLDSVLNIYTSQNCGLELAHMTCEHEVDWLHSQWEKLNEICHLDYLNQHNLAKLMLECETFDHFMGAKFPATKRYGCEGAEPMLVVLDETLRLCHLGSGDQDELTSSIGRIDDVIIGMPHRGRLNLLACLLGFEPMAIFSKTRGEPELDLARAWQGQGDVLSHLSTNCRFVYGLDRHHIGLSRDTPDPINVTLLPNPSHLEVASPMAMGTARGRAHNIQHAYSSSPKFVTPFGATRKQQQQQQQQQQQLDSTGNNMMASSYAQYLPTILPIQIHGDASVAGQGIIQETLQMANLPAFTAGGSLHLIVNNQIGYTTDQTLARSSRNCTDIFKLIEAPIIHVNAQNIASVVRATRLALTYRQKFAKDVAINLVCYRQHGHNELDEPAFTQPLMYERIRKRKSIPVQYCEQIGMDDLERAQIVDRYKLRLQEAYKSSERYKPDNDNYRNFELPTEFHRDHVLSWQTGVELNTLKAIALDSVEVPPNFKVHPNLLRALVNERKQRFSTPITPTTTTTTTEAAEAAALNQIKVDWATAEMLAFGSLLKQNHSVRLAGQDVARGTFSTRHAILFDQDTQRPYVPLNEMSPTWTQAGSDAATATSNSGQQQHQQQAKLEVANTILSEEAALAYEFAYSVETCALTVWEAQFGDFFNTAQSIVDTLISSSETKWLKQSALTMLLPHGLDGAGPEHSSAHLERFLQMSSSSSSSIDTEAKVNWSVCFPTLPSQYFHLLRRQVLRPFRKPLVVLAPKVIFRHPECQSELSEFNEDKSFQTILDDPSCCVANSQLRQQVDTAVLCSGKIYFTLSELKRKHAINNVALIRIEELCPFPVQSIMQTLRQYPGLRMDQCVWFQEEHENQGAYNYVASRLANIANVRLNYIGRQESELPATGSASIHKRELDQLLKQFKSLKSS